MPILYKHFTASSVSFSFSKECHLFSVEGDNEAQSSTVYQRHCTEYLCVSENDENERTWVCTAGKESTQLCNSMDIEMFSGFTGCAC